MPTFSSISSQDSIIAHHHHQQTSVRQTTPPALAANSCAYPRTSTHNTKSNATTSPDRTTKCATVTMMLAERIIHNDWSVEDEHFFETNTMNVWQTLEFLSGLNTRKRYNYEGYNDAKNALRTLTPSWRRDSFVEKNVNPNGDESNTTSKGKYTTVTSTHVADHDTALSKTAGGGTDNEGNDLRIASAGINSKKHSRYARKRSSHGKNNRNVCVFRKRTANKNLNINELDPEYALSPSEYTDLIKCTFNLPRISAALERLMGTNVVRLTDRNYMKELRERIEDDYRENLQKRIKARELKEVERERILIIEGKTKVIPAELADDPIFVVNKKADGEILKTRAKLKTNREKNADRLKLQGVKWERERLQHEELENQRINIMRQRYSEQKALEEQYKDEDEHRGIDLLRIDNEDWRPCEQQLKEFLEQERAKMKERSLRIPTPFTTDTKDINNIIRARKAFREVERRIRKAIEDNHEKQTQQKQSAQQQPQHKTHSPEQILHEAAAKALEDNAIVPKDIFELEDVTPAVQKNVASDDGSDISSGESMDEGSTISVSKQRFAQMLHAELEKDVADGLLISKEQYDHLRYEDDKIMQLRSARDIRELYLLAEEIIIGEHIESTADEEEAMAEEEEEDIESDKD